MSKQRVLNVAIRGRGVGCRLHYPIWRDLGAEVTFLQAASNLTDDFDIIVVAVPPSHQIDEVETLAGKARFIICEKPFGTSFQRSRRKQLRRTSEKILINYQLRYIPECILADIRHLFGRHREVRVSYKSDAIKPNDFSGEVLMRYLRGGGVRYAVLSHLLDFFTYLGIFDSQARFAAKSTNSINGVEIAIRVEILKESGGEVASTVIIDVDLASELTEFLIYDNRQSDVIDLLKPYSSMGKSGASPLSSSGFGPWRQAYRDFACEISDFLLFSQSINLRAGSVDDAEKVHSMIAKL